MIEAAEALYKTADYIDEHGLWQGGGAYNPDDYGQGCLIGSFNKATNGRFFSPVLDSLTEHLSGAWIVDWSDNAPSAEYVTQELRFCAKRIEAGDL